jgi:adenylate cyclase class 2
MQKIEKEIKIELTDYKKQITNLLDIGCRFISFYKQITYRLDTKGCLLEEKGLFLRVRKDDISTVTLKEKISSKKQIKERKETEFKIDDFRKMIYIFKKLGFKDMKIMEKFRANFKYKHLIISIDEMPFGFFMEIEGPENEMKNVVKKLSLTDKKRLTSTYWDIFQDINNRKHIIRKNIVFSSKYKSKISVLFI